MVDDKTRLESTEVGAIGSDAQVKRRYEAPALVYLGSVNCLTLSQSNLAAADGSLKTKTKP